MSLKQQEYSPERITYYLEHWSELVAAAEGGTGQLGGNGTRSDRLVLVCLLADLEAAADRLPRYWTSTRDVFRMQGRMRTWWKANIAYFEERSMADAVNAMAHSLGWLEDIENAPGDEPGALERYRGGKASVSDEARRGRRRP